MLISQLFSGKESCKRNKPLKAHRSRPDLHLVEERKVSNIASNIMGQFIAKAGDGSLRNCCAQTNNSNKKAVLSWFLADVNVFLIYVSPPGIGYASFVIVSLLNIYYIVILAWGLYYLFQCFQPELPWAKCKQPWNTDSCIEDTVRKNKTMWLAANITNFTSPVTEFWE